MPKPNGFDVCRAIKAATSGMAGTTVVMLTAKGQAYDREQGIAAGADLYLTKPFDPDELLRRAREVLGLATGRVPGRPDGAGRARRLIVRHRHVAPMLSVAPGGHRRAASAISDATGEVILDRQTAPLRRMRLPSGTPIVVEGQTVGWVEGPRPAGVDRRGPVLRRRARDRQAIARARGARPLPRAEPDLRPRRPDRRPSSRRRDRDRRRRRGEPPADGRHRVRAPPRGRRRGCPLDRTPGRRPIGAQDATAASSARSSRATPRSSTTSPPIPGRPRPSGRFGSLVAAPLRGPRRTIGVIGAVTRERVEFHASDLKLLAAIAALAAPTFDQARRCSPPCARRAPAPDRQRPWRVDGSAGRRLVGVLASTLVLAYPRGAPPGLGLDRDVVLAALLPAGLVLYGGAARRRAGALREAQGATRAGVPALGARQPRPPRSVSPS